MEKDIILTKEGLEKLEKSFKDLKEEQKGVIARIKAARRLGDLTENSEYEDAKNQQAFIEGKLKEIEWILGRAKIVPKIISDKVSFGCKVTVKINHKIETYQLVAALESDPSVGKISVQSPLGKAIDGLKKGDKFKISTPEGIREGEILKLE